MGGMPHSPCHIDHLLVISTVGSETFKSQLSRDESCQTISIRIFGIYNSCKLMSPYRFYRWSIDWTVCGSRRSIRIDLKNEMFQQKKYYYKKKQNRNCAETATASLILYATTSTTPNIVFFLSIKKYSNFQQIIDH